MRKTISDAVSVNATPEPDLRSYVERRSLELILDGARWTIAIFGHLFVVALLAWVMVDQVNRIRTALWAVTLAAILVGQAMFATRYPPDRINGLDAKGIAEALHRFTRSAWMVGICWALAPFVFFPSADRELQLFLVFVMGGMSLSAVGTQHVYLPACYASMSFAVPLLGLQFALQGRVLEPVLLVLYTAIILRLARTLSRFSMRTITLQHERDRLLAALTSHARDLEAARLAADEANLAKSRFLAQASHDLRQPLHAIGLFVETLSTERMSDVAGQVIHRVRESLAMLSKLFDSLLDITVLDARQSPPQLSDFALSELFEMLERDFAPVASDNGVSLRFMKTSAVVRSDPVLFRRMLQNLVSNAVRHAPGARVVVGARRPGKHRSTWRVDVIDTGPGIDALDRDRIFQEFVKLDSGARTGGLGLGLSIVRRLQVLLRLDVSVDSSRGAGTRFRIEGIEAGRSSPERLIEDGLPPRFDSLADLSILVVDDDPQVLHATGELLRRWGCEVTTSADLPEDADGFDVIVTDHELEGISGLDRLRGLRSRGIDTRAVLLTGNSSPAIQQEAEAMGVPVLHKPVRPVQLRSVLLHVLTQSAGGGDAA